MHTHQQKPGYILLLSILFIGSIASAIVISLLLLGTGTQRTASSFEKSAKALALSQACVEYALTRLRENPSYQGEEIVSDFSLDETCRILRIGGGGNHDRIICAETYIGSVSRKLEIIVETILPTTKIYSWQEVPYFSLCES